jgi:hypothetical protein
MAILFADGCDIGFPADTNGIWTSVTKSNAVLTYQTAEKFSGLGAMKFVSTVTTGRIFVSRTLISDLATVYIAFRWKYQGTLAGATDNFCPLVQFTNDASTRSITLGVSSVSKVFTAYRGTTTPVLLDTGSKVLELDTWYWVEIRQTSHDSAGVFQVRVDEIEDILFNGQTNHSGNAVTRAVSVGIPLYASASGATATWFVDDVIFDDAGHPGVKIVQPMFPDAEGNSGQWTITGGGTTPEAIDDCIGGAVPDDDTTMLSSAVVGERFSVSTSDPTELVANVHGVVLVSRVRGDGGGEQMAQSVRVGASELDGPTFAPGGSWSWRADPFPVSPDTGIAWTQPEIIAMEMGGVVK